MITAIQSEECDLGITYSELVTPRDNSVCYGAQEFAAFFPKNHPFCARPGISRDELERNHGTGSSPRALSVDLHPAIDPMMESIMAQSRKRAAILPITWSASEELKSVPIEPPLMVPTSLVWNPRHFLTREAQFLREALAKG